MPLIIIITLWLIVPILVEVVTNLTTKTLLKISNEVSGFWDFMSGQMRLSPPAHFRGPFHTNLVYKDEWEKPVIMTDDEVKLTQDWEYPTLERESPKLVNPKFLDRTYSFEQPFPEDEVYKPTLPETPKITKLQELPILVNPDAPREMVFPKVKDEPGYNWGDGRLEGEDLE